MGFMLTARVSRKDSQEVTRARLRQAAVRVFARDGIAGSRIETIAQDAGYSRGAFYSNYRSKRDLLVDLLHDKQTAEIDLWRDVLSHTVDVHADLAQLSARYDGITDVRERAMLNSELQLEADRDETFRPIFQSYLDAVYSETRSLFELLFKRHSKRVPDNLDTIAITVRLLGMGLGSPSLVGTQVVKRVGAGRIMFEYISNVMASAPDQDAPENI
jgi:AcrR family transcriptional regulator